MVEKARRKLNCAAIDAATIWSRGIPKFIARNRISMQTSKTHLQSSGTSVGNTSPAAASNIDGEKGH